MAEAEKKGFRAGRRRVIWGACVLLVAGGIAAVWWWRSMYYRHGHHPTLIVVSGDTAGWIVPCGCTSNQSGGLLRRGSYVGELRRKADVVLVDAGGAPAGTSAYQRVKFEAILRGEIEMGLVAHNIGGPEAALGADYLRGLGETVDAPLISANLKDTAGRPVADALRIVAAGGHRIAFVGVLSSRYESPGTRIDDPRQAILAEVSRARGQYDALVVLAYAPEDELQRLAGQLPEVDAIVGGPTGQSIAPRKVGPTLLASAANKGKFLVALEALTGGRGINRHGQVIEMSDRWADDPRQVKNVEQYLADLAAKDFAPEQTGLVPPLPPNTPPDYRITGNRACRDCHQEDCRLWDDSRHAQAWHVLKEKGEHVDPDCQQCHTTGYGLPGGFTTIATAASRGGVGCENCHGPSLAHVENPDRKTPFDAKDQCIRCHDQENSPKFNYDQYWARIKHGETPGIRPDRTATRPAATEARP
jgi:hypothetical protein